jgi:purine-binding chemotaxis protein CheW
VSEEAVTSVKQLVVFKLAEEEYGVDIATVQSIIQMQEITAVPGATSFVAGVINLRGSVIPVINLRQRFGLEQVETDKDTRILVVKNEGEQDIGAIVDSVAEVLRVPIDSIEPPSEMIMTTDSDYMQGIIKLDGGRLVILLNVEKVLNKETCDTIKVATAQASESAKAKTKAKQEEPVTA